MIDDLEASLDEGRWFQVPGGRFSGNQGWAVRALPLTLSGQSVLRLRFRFESNASKSFDGVYIDDLVLQVP